MTGPTPGPWVAETETQQPAEIWPANICTLGWGIWVRQEHGIPDDIPPEAECATNARLIAAAPDLLAAARLFLAVLANGGRIEGNNAGVLVELRFLDVIAKVDGV